MSPRIIISSMKVYLKLRPYSSNSMEPTDIFSYVGITLIILGIAIIIIAFLLLVFRGIEGAEKVKGGGIILIGPFPIVFGTDKETMKILLLFAIILVVVLIGLIIGFNMLKA